MSGELSGWVSAIVTAIGLPDPIIHGGKPSSDPEPSRPIDDD